ncbi:MAG: CsbD family protein [Mycobacterium sp.]|uniref:CsbD family protein n=1 Tax=Mycobacterium sp. TaxID=1785 RepID=UPI001ED4A11C|nr:CsbD family protein [Mycobacterium sp.]MBW0018947.1 CsbD family protein [Mycobacterium sp.]
MTGKNSRLRNKAQYWSGKARETVGRITGNRRTQYGGKLDQAKANLKDLTHRRGNGIAGPRA